MYKWLSMGDNAYVEQYMKPLIQENKALRDKKVETFDKIYRLYTYPKCDFRKRFTEIMESGVGSAVDIGFFKFCYVDIMRDCDPQRIFDDYSTAMEELTEKYPDVKFMHVTVPIRSIPKQAKRYLKQTIKLLIGKPGFFEDNIVRHNYNNLLRNAYSKTGLFFDLAFIESVNINGFGCYALKRDEKVAVMAPEYTEDAGHLNSLGRKKAAEQLLIKLAETASHS